MWIKESWVKSTNLLHYNESVSEDENEIGNQTIDTPSENEMLHSAKKMQAYAEMLTSVRKMVVGTIMRKRPLNKKQSLIFFQI